MARRAVVPAPVAGPVGQARGAQAGFTLLEVMVAVAILGLSLTVILSAQVGLFSSGTYGQHVSEAIGLSRCKMTELEEQFLKFGYPEVDANDEGPCCNNDTRPDMKCMWKIERVELPQPQGVDSGSFDGGSPAGSAGLNLGNPAPTSTSGDTSLGPLSALAQATGQLPGGGMSSGSGTSGLSGMLAAGASGGTGAIAPLVMGIVYPSIKPMLEASIRRVTVIVMWREGLAKRDLEILQWVANPTKGGFLAQAALSDSAAPGGGIPGLPGGLPGGGVTPQTPGARPQMVPRGGF